MTSSDLFVETAFDNGSPCGWAIAEDGALELTLMYDHARFTGNREAAHFNVRLHVAPASIGRTLTVRIAHSRSCWNGYWHDALGRPMLDDGLALAVRQGDGLWEILRAEVLDGDPQWAVRLSVPLNAERVQLARNVPYGERELERLIARVRAHPRGRVTRIGSTAEGRALELIEIGDAADQFLVRGRCHAWETGGSWFIEGLADHLLSPAGEATLARVSVAALPMANRDGVARGMSRYNALGADLNRGWDGRPDPAIMPENACLYAWIESRMRAGRPPRLAMCLHNDTHGKLHLPDSSKRDAAQARRFATLEALMRERTWFREGSTDNNWSNTGSFSQGLGGQFGFDAVILELHSEWAAGLDRPPLHTDWMAMGAGFAALLPDYFAQPR